MEEGEHTNVAEVGEDCQDERPCHQVQHCAESDRCGDQSRWDEEAVDREGVEHDGGNDEEDAYGVGEGVDPPTHFFKLLPGIVILKKLLQHEQPSSQDWLPVPASALRLKPSSQAEQSSSTSSPASQYSASVAPSRTAAVPLAQEQTLGSQVWLPGLAMATGLRW